MNGKREEAKREEYKKMGVTDFNQVRAKKMWELTRLCLKKNYPPLNLPTTKSWVRWFSVANPKYLGFFKTKQMKRLIREPALFRTTALGDLFEGEKT